MHALGQVEIERARARPRWQSARLGRGPPRAPRAPASSGGILGAGCVARGAAARRADASMYWLVSFFEGIWAGWPMPRGMDGPASTWITSIAVAVAVVPTVAVVANAVARDSTQARELAAKAGARARGAAVGARAMPAKVAASAQFARSELKRFPEALKTMAGEEGSPLRTLADAGADILTLPRSAAAAMADLGERLKDAGHAGDMLGVIIDDVLAFPRTLVQQVAPVASAIVPAAKAVAAELNAVVRPPPPPASSTHRVPGTEAFTERGAGAGAVLPPSPPPAEPMFTPSPRRQRPKPLMEI